MVEPSVQVPGGVVLVVDDDVATRTLVTRLLEQSGFDCREATTGEEALALLKRRGETIDCIVLDVRMPGISGFDVLEAVRADPMIAGIALHHGLVLVTANTSHFQRIADLGYPLELENWRETPSA